MSLKSRINDNLENDILAFFGAPGAGKTFEINKTVPPTARCLAFDPGGSVANIDKSFEVVSSVPAFLKAVRRKGNIRIALQMSGKAAFNSFCRIVYAQADARQITYVWVDELSQVTTASKAPEDWGYILNIGRKFGLKIRAGAQRAPEIDKTLIGNQTGIWIGFQGRRDDSEYLARQTNIPFETIDGLRRGPFFDCIRFKDRTNFRTDIAETERVKAA